MNSATRAIAVLAALGSLVALPSRAVAVTCSVITTVDQMPSVTGSLRWCVEDIGNSDGVATDIVFNLSGSSPHVISLVDELEITEANTTIDGTTQSGYVAATSSTAAVHSVVLDASISAGATILNLNGGLASIEGLEFRNQTSGVPAAPDYAIEVRSSDNEIYASRIHSSDAGILVTPGRSGNIIGSATAADRNVVEGCATGPGIALQEPGAGNVLEGNTLTGNQSYGVLAAYDQGATSDAVDIIGNLITQNGVGGVTAHQVPVSITGNNQILNNSGYGIAATNEVSGAINIVFGEVYFEVEGNTIDSNTGPGVVIGGAEFQVLSNTITNNAGFGVYAASSLGPDDSPTATADDAIAHGLIGYTGQKNTIQGNVGGIIVVDASTNANAGPPIPDLDDANTLGGNTGNVEIGVLWPGNFVLENYFGSPLQQLSVDLWSAGGSTGGGTLLESGVTDLDGNFTPPSQPSYDPLKVSTWMLVPSLIVLDLGGPPLTRLDLAPHEIEVEDAPWYNTAYAWDGTGGASGPKVGTCVVAFGACRNQSLVERTDITCEEEFGAVTPTNPRPYTCFTANVPVTGDTREVAVCEPNNLPSGERPLVIGLHGGGPTGVTSITKSNGGCQMLKLAVRDGFIVAFPLGNTRVDNNSATRGWRDCRTSTGIDPIDNTNDVEFITNLVPHLENLDLNSQRYDENRLYVWGVSNGAMMTYRLIRQIQPNAFGSGTGTPAFAGVATIIGNEPQRNNPPEIAADPSINTDEVGNECFGSSPPSPLGDLLIMNGTADKQVRYSGGWVSSNSPSSLTMPGDAHLGAVRATTLLSNGVDDTRWGSESSVAYWANQMSIPFGNLATADEFVFADKTPVGSGTPVPGEDNSTVGLRVDGDPSPTSRLIRTYVVEGGGHQVPGTENIQALGNDLQNCYPGLNPENFLGCVNRDIYMAEEVWNSFQPRRLWEDFEAGTSPFGFGGESIVPPTTATIQPDTAARMGALDSAVGLKIGPLHQGATAVLFDDFSSAPLSSFRARFWIGTEQLTISSSPSAYIAPIAILNSSTSGAIVRIYNVGGNYVARADLDGTAGPMGPDLPLVPNGDTLLEVQWKADSGAGSTSDAYFCVRRIDEFSTYSSVPAGPTESCMEGFNPSPNSIDRVRFGASVSGSASVTGDLYLDGYESYVP